TAGEEVIADYRALHLTLKSHPMALLRDDLARLNMVPSAALGTSRDGMRLAVAGIVLVRQRPGTAKGVIFATLEDETGIANIIIWPDTFARYRKAVLGSRLMGVIGKLQREGQVVHVIAERIVDLSHHLDRLGLDPEESALHQPGPDGPLPFHSRDFH